MNKHDECFRAYTHTSRAWYGRSALGNSDDADRVTFGLYSHGGGTTGEMGMRWDHIGAQLTVWNDAWGALAIFRDVIAELAKVDNHVTITPEQFTAILDRCGFRDDTPEKYGDSYPTDPGAGVEEVI